MVNRSQMGAPPAILSVQSAVAYGHVGNAAATLPLQLLGYEVWPVDTVQFSNHPAHGGFRGRITDPALIAELLDGLAERGFLQSCAALLTGYLGEAATGAAALAALGRLKAANPNALYCCDPVIGDHPGGAYVRPGLVEFFRDAAIPASDLATPNRFELEVLTGLPAGNLAEALAAAEALRCRGPRLVLASGLGEGVAEPDTVAMLVATAEGAWRVATPKLPLAASGTGDALAALLLGHYLRSRDPAAALGAAASAIFAVVEATHALGADELALVAARHALLDPPRRFTAQRIG